MWEDIKDFIKEEFIAIIGCILVGGVLVAMIVMCIESAMTMHFEREFARENGYYPTKTTIMDERSE